MKLNRYNYEEYFILYVDNELSSEECREVELFAQENPDLKTELDILLQSKLTPDADIQFADKGSLMRFGSTSVNMNNYEEWLLCYIDDELDNNEKAEVEKFLAANPAIQKELSLLQKAKLQPETITFPDKESLYRRTEKAKVIAIGWRRIAVAAVLLIGITTTAIVLLNNRSGDEQGKVADKEKTETPVNTKSSDDNKNTPGVQPQNINNEKKEELAANTSEKKNGSSVKELKKYNNSGEKDQDLSIRKNENVIAESKIKKDNGLPEPTDENSYVNGINKPNDAITGNTDADAALTDSKNKTEVVRVTPEPTNSSDQQNEAKGKPENNSDAHFASNNEGKSNKGLRGFLRKVTRTFEKRTNIKATDDDDHLLIAGLAIKM